MLIDLQSVQVIKQMEALEQPARDLVDRLDARLHEPLDFNEAYRLIVLVIGDEYLKTVLRKIVSTLEELG